MKVLKLAIVMTLCFMSTGCINRMNNDSIISEAMKCERVGLPWRSVYNYDGTVAGVICTPLGEQAAFKKRY